MPQGADDGFCLGEEPFVTTHSWRKQQLFSPVSLLRTTSRLSVPFRLSKECCSLRIFQVG